jgi:DNA-binding MarR family transcriptional regulator
MPAVRDRTAARARPSGAPRSDPLPAAGGDRPAAARSSRPAAPDPRRVHTTAALDNLRRIVRALRVAAGSTESSTGLTAAQLFVLQVVHAEPGSSLTQIAARTMTDRTSVAAVVDRLVERGLAARRPSPADRRRVEIVATRAAAPVLARAPHPPTRRVLDGLAALDDRDLRRLAGGLGALARAMHLDGEPAVMLFDDAPAPAPRGGRARPAPRGP